MSMEMVRYVNAKNAISVSNNFQCLLQPISYSSLLDSAEFQAALFNKNFLTTANMERHQHALWFCLLQCKTAETTEIVTNLVKENELLACVKDFSGRMATDVATPEKKKAINSILLWHSTNAVILAHRGCVKNGTVCIRVLINQRNSLPLPISLFSFLYFTSYSTVYHIHSNSIVHHKQTLSMVCSFQAKQNTQCV